MRIRNHFTKITGFSIFLHADGSLLIPFITAAEPIAAKKGGSQAFRKPVNRGQNPTQN
jgi:hypothetical protein